MSALDSIRIDTGPNPRTAIIWLHGLGADGHDFEPLVPEMCWDRAPPLRFVFPHAPMRPVTINAGMVMRAWYDISAADLSRGGDEAGIRASAALVEALIGAEEESGIARQGIVLGGFSQGGAIALFTGLKQARPLAGIVALSCYLPLAEALAAERSPASGATPILMGHGRADPLVPVALGQLSAERLKAWGHPVQWHTYDVAHGVALDEVADVRAWLRARLDPGSDAPD